MHQLRLCAHALALSFVVLAARAGVAQPSADRVAAADDRVAALRDQLQGKWRLDSKNATWAYSIQEFDGTKSTVTRFDREGNQVDRHESLYEVTIADGAKVLAWWKDASKSPRDRRAKPAPDGAYVFTVYEDTFVEARGFMAGDEGKPWLMRWTRVEE